MKHLASILWLISLPIVVYLTYLSILWAIKIFNKNNQDSEN